MRACNWQRFGRKSAHLGEKLDIEAASAYLSILMLQDEEKRELKN